MSSRATYPSVFRSVTKLPVAPTCNVTGAAADSDVLGVSGVLGIPGVPKISGAMSLFFPNFSSSSKTNLQSRGYMPADSNDLTLVYLCNRFHASTAHMSLHLTLPAALCRWHGEPLLFSSRLLKCPCSSSGLMLVQNGLYMLVTVRTLACDPHSRSHLTSLM